MALEWKTIPYSDEVADAAHGHALSDLTDVAIGIPADGDALVWNDALNVWEPGAGGGGGALDDLTDVALGTPQTGHVLTFNETYWESAPPQGATTLDSLTDVTADTPQEGDVITFFQGGWMATAPVSDADTLDGEHASAFADASHIHALYELSEVTITDPQAGDVLTFNAVAWENAPPSTDADTLDGEHASAFAASAHGHALDDLSDVALGAPSTGHVLTYDTDHWEAAAPAAGAAALDDLSDVALGTPQTGHVLTFDTDHWEAAAPAAGAAALDDLTDVVLGTPATGNVLTYDTDHWEAAAPGAPAIHTHAGTDITSTVANATDADTLDGEHAGAFADAEHTHVKADITDLAIGVEETGDLIVGFNDIASINYAFQATVISFSSYTAPHTPSRMLDGNSIDEGTLTYWNAASYTAGSYVIIDLGQPRPINYIGTLGSSTEGNRANFEVEYSTDNVTYTLAHRFSEITTAENNVHLPQTITARYWKIKSTGYTYGYNNWIMYSWELREFTGSIRTYPLAVGDNTQILVADDAETLGVKWADHDHSAEFAPISHTHAEADITDLTHDAASLRGYEVADTEPQDGATLVWNAMTAKWTPGEAAGTGGGGTLANLLDVGIPATPDNNQVLTWQTGAGQWKAISLPTAPSTARVREFDFQAEYPGAIIDPSALGDGLLEAFADAGHNAYEWTVVSTSEQSAYLYLRWRLPPGFTSFAGPLKVTSKVSNVARNCGVEVLGLYDAAGANAIAYVTLKNADWTEDSINLVAGTFAAGDTVLAKLRIFGQDTSVTYLAGIRIQYIGD